MKKEKHDIISESDFTKLNLPKIKHHYPLPSEVIPDDENIDTLDETLLGMEYDIESEEEIENAIPDEDSEYLMSESEKESEEGNNEDNREIEQEEEVPSHSTSNAHP
jgi:hypothetical protein